MLQAIEAKAARAARKTGLAVGGGLCFVVGAAFLTSAAWIYLSQVLDTLSAALIIGGVYAGVGLVLFGLAGRSSESADIKVKAEAKAQMNGHAPQHEGGEQPPLVQAFLFGMQAGANAGGKSKPH